MEAMVYRKKVTPGGWSKEPSVTRDMENDPDRATTPLSPELFYPLVTEQERVTWTYWLPTIVPSLGTLTDLIRLKAPTQVIEEFQWAWDMELFEAYEVRTAVRDPLLLGRLGQNWYRIALWGESLLPMEEITALVQKSLALRRRAYRRRVWFIPIAVVGILTSAAGLAWLGSEQNPVLPLLLGLMLSAVTLMCLAGTTPEICQQNFLRRYRH